MFIKEVILEGFKSYAQRTVISGFDPHFNAITGLNGSGKSNILDAICFVFGITNLSLVRVEDLKGIVYKKGQGRTKRATVTIIFDNKDKTNGPDAYEQFSEITVTRHVTITQGGTKNKYLINGHLAQPTAVKNLFHSVGLNVNNPHFLIMQGRITKIVKMKPIEILGLLEESAGTKMFEMKKENAIKTIEKKQLKVDEFSSVIKEEIAPKLEKLSGEQKNYIQWTSNNKEIESLKKLSIAYSYLEEEKRLEVLQKEKEEQEKVINDLKDQQNNLKKKIKETEKQYNELVKKKDLEAEGEIQQLEKGISLISKQLVKLNSDWNHTKESLEKDQKNKSSIEKAILDLEISIEKKKKQFENFDEQCKKLESEAEQENQLLNEKKRQYQAAIAGAASENDDDSAKTWADQLMQAKTALTTSKSEQTQHNTKVQLLTKELAERQSELSSLGAKSSKLQREFDDVRQQVVISQKALEKLNFNDEIERKLSNDKKALQQQIAECREQISSLSARLSRLKFNYTDPTNNFNRSSVKGVVAQLIEMKNPDRDAIALEVAAGSRLYNVVVDTEETASLLLKKGKLQHRVTIIPLDSIDARSIAPEKIKRAEKIVGKENVNAALSLVGSAGDLQSAMKFVFGNCFICPNMESAKEVTQDREISVKSVTLDGEVFDPQGTLTGGSRSKSTPILKELTLLKVAKERLVQLEGQLNQIDDQLRSAKRYYELKEVYQLKQHESELLEQRLAQTPTHQLQSKIKSIENSIEESKELIKELSKKEKEAAAKVKELEKRSNDSESFREAQLKSLEKAITAAKTSAANAVKLSKNSQQKRETLLLQIEELTNEIKSNRESINEISGKIEKWTEDCSQLENKISELDEEFNSKKREMEGKKNKLQKANEEIRNLNNKKEEYQKNINEIGLTVQKSEYAWNKSIKDQADAKHHIAHLIERFPWIPDDKRYFGKEGTEYDFNKIDPKQAQKRLAKLEEVQSKLSKSINRKVMNMFENAQKEYDDLKEKIEILLTNKKTIEDFIEDLEEKKIEALNITWAKVNTDFASIFTALLPGWTAKLDPPEGGTLTDGLRILFARDGVWKESLSELSGGQRSLLALSLILALLRVKPAPVYILDEVDSALDLSNTQNIGKMLKTHFSQSQFLVVSLKEGMWNNANVLFRTKFVEGVSTVTRTTPKQQNKNK